MDVPNGNNNDKQQRSQELLQRLQGEPLKVEELVLQAGSIGNQEYQFAAS
jgi:hypothetical protein